ncbi:MAG: GTP 3',8-cyclase MoaA [bacterium]
MISPATSAKAITDRYNRPMRSLRLSVTDHCNLNCWYCRAEEEACTLKHEDIISYEEMARITEVFAKLGVKKVRLTGGEPLLRPDIEELVKLLKKIKGLDEVTLTTNGVLLTEKIEALAAAGLDRINMSLDTFDKTKFQQLTGHDSLERSLAGLERLLATPELHPIKINTVAIRGFNETELLDFVNWAKENNQTVRFIEFMPLERGLRWQKEKLLLTPEIKQILTRRFDLTPLSNDTHDTDNKYRIDASQGVVGFISSVSKPFCDSCDRIRMTADGKIMNCLFSYTSTDIKKLLRGGRENELPEKIISTFKSKWKGGSLLLREGTYQPKQQTRTMSKIGG